MSKKEIKKGDLIKTKENTIGLVSEEGPENRPIESGFDAQECLEKHIGDVEVMDFEKRAIYWTPKNRLSKNLNELEQSSEEE